VYSVYIIAEAAQGYLPLVGEQGSSDTALLLVRAAAAAGADAVKFQIVYVEELAQPGNVHFDIFQRLEMDESTWRRVRNYAAKLGVDFIADVFGPRSFTVARNIGVDAIKLHSTSFFDHSLISNVLALGCPAYFSLGGIEPAEIDAFIERHGARNHGKIVLLYGFQAEPTPLENNNLARIPALIARTGLPIGFMDHSDGAGPDATYLSVLALGIGIQIFEKHVTLDRELELEDYMSALAPGRLREYVETLRRLAHAVGSQELDLTLAERNYREKAVKRVTAARPVAAGARLCADDICLIRPTTPRGAFKAEDLLGRCLRRSIATGEAISVEDVE
jgi:N,N'-diacetyllegionaminate synthase